MEKSKLRSSLIENICVLIDFIYEKWYGRAWAKRFVDLKKGGLALGR
jgi:hypothetical protein